jgi:hypothetical protein
MGAALTYARRYALFTLVGIAGDDDLDAPDLNVVPHGDTPQPAPTARAPNGLDARAGPSSVGRRSKTAPPRPPPLADDQSHDLRNRLLAELDALHSADAAFAWASARLAAKSRLSADDAKILEAKFRARVAPFVQGAEGPEDQGIEGLNGQGQDAVEIDDAASRTASVNDPGSAGRQSHEVPGETADEPGDPRPRLIGKIIRLRDSEHRKFVCRQACVMCGRTPSDPHHLRFAQPRALASKVSDEFIVPLCRVHHRELHRRGDEEAWWRERRIDPIAIALALWRGRGERSSDPLA